MTDWLDYQAVYPAPEHSIAGTINILPGLWSPQLNTHRAILIYLPPSYARGERHYPVLYMHDGQNLFDAATSYSGEWQVDETLEVLSRDGIEAIVVGIFHGGERRVIELSPFPIGAQMPEPLAGRAGEGARYLDFVRETLKPLVDRDFRTLPDRAHTGIMGSSMGGLISFYAFFQHPETFGLAGCMSSAFHVCGDAPFTFAQQAPFVPGRLYLDVGTQEYPPAGSGAEQQRSRALSQRYVSDSRRMVGLLIEKGYRPGDTLHYVEEEGAPHHESAWARRLPEALRFLLGGLS